MVGSAILSPLFIMFFFLSGFHCPFVSQGNDVDEEQYNVGTVCLINRTLPERPPPRIIVLVGPSAVGCSKMLNRLMEEFPDR